jgi:hypothetical protein
VPRDASTTSAHMTALPKPQPATAVVDVTLVFKGVAVDAAKIYAGLDAQFGTVTSPKDADPGFGYGPFIFEIAP